MKDLRGVRTPTRDRERRPTLPRWSEVIDLRLVGAFVGGLAIVLALSLALDWVRDPQTLTIRAVEMEGEFNRVQGRDIRRVVVRQGPAGFFSVDMGEMRRAVEALPWVAEASVRRIWPNRLGVKVREHVPLAYWGEDALVSRQGVLLRPEPDSFPDGLPHFDGPDDLAPDLVARYRDMRRALAPVGQEVARLEVDDRRSWQLTMGNGIEVVLGRDDVHQRLLRLVHNWPRRLALHEGAIQRVDLRYTNGFAVRWKEDERPELGARGQRESRNV